MRDSFAAELLMRWILPSIVCILAAVPIHAATVKPAPDDASQRAAITQLITADVREATGSAAAIQIMELSAAKHVKQCPDAPQVSLSGNGNYRIAEVHCRALGWNLYFPVQISARRDDVVATHTLLPGHVIHPSDLRVVSVASAPAQQSATSVAAVIGKTVKSPIASGVPVDVSNLESPVVVHAGQRLTLTVTSGSVTVTTTVVATQEGRTGQWIVVRNTKSGTRVRAKVDGQGGVSYNLGG